MSNDEIIDWLDVQGTTEAHAARDRIAELEAENAHLKGLEALSYMSYQGAEKVITELRQQLEAVQKDAERYQWLRKQHWSTSKMAVVMRPTVAIRLQSYCPSEERLDREIRRAMAEEKEQIK